MNLQINPRILILCEDSKSSKGYFESFKQDEELKRHLGSVQIISPPKNSPYYLVDEAIKQKEKAKVDGDEWDEIWVVFDKDTHPNIDEAFKSARMGKINIAISIVCWEYWILLHFEKSKTPYTTCKYLIKYLKQNYLRHYDKNKIYFDILKPKIPFAMNNAKKIQKEMKSKYPKVKIYDLPAFTDVNRLVEKLFKKNVIK